MIRLSFLPLIFTFSISVAFSQDLTLNFRHLTTSDGLSQNSIHSIIQDHKGFMWFATEDGLNKYDGYHLTIYKNINDDNNSLSNNSINYLFEDKQNNLWIATIEGLNLYNRETDDFTVFKASETDSLGLRSDFVSTIYQDSNGDTWVGSPEGLFKYNYKSQNFSQFTHSPEDPQSLSDERIVSIFEDKKKNFWIGTHNGLNLLDRATGKCERFYHKNKKNDLSDNNYIKTITEDKKGNLWLGTWGGGLRLLDRETKTFKSYVHDENNSKSIGGNTVYDIFIDSKNNFWIGVENGGLNLFDPNNETFKIYYSNNIDLNSISNNSVECIYEDNSGTLWLGVHRGGVNYYNPKQDKFKSFVTKPYENSISHNNVRAFCEDKEGNIWIGTDGGGLNMFNRETNTFTVFKNDKDDTTSLSSDVVLSILEDSEGLLWIGTYGSGLNRFDRKKGTFKRYVHDPHDPNSLGGNIIWSIIEDNNGNLLIATRGNGVNLFNKKTNKFTRYKCESEGTENISSCWTAHLLQDSRQNIWIATTWGLSLFDPETQSSIHFFPDDKNKGSVSGADVYIVFEDSKYNIWVSTNKGLNLFDYETQTFEVFKESDGLPNNRVASITEDHRGNLWLGTFLGLSKFNPETHQFKNYTVADGLQGNEFSQNASLKARDGHMFFGGIEGFNMFHPDSVKKDNDFLPPVYITNFQIFNKKIDLGKNISEIKEIVLAPDESVFSLEFAALNFINSERNQYAYKLEGFDKEWNYVGNKRTATYTNLDPGKHTFKVKGSNNDGIWSTDEASIDFTITPPYWKTWWFRVLIVFSVLGTSFAGYSIRLNSINKQKEFLEKEVQERTSEVLSQAEKLKIINTELEDQKKKIIIEKEDANNARKEAEKANMAKSAFLATMSHEIRTPMNGVIGMTSLLTETSLTSEQRQYTETIKVSGESLLTIINDILDFSKIESGMIELDTYDFDLRQCIEEVMDLFADKAAHQGVDLIYQLDPRIPVLIQGDSHRLRQILINLVGNALKFTKQGEVFLSAEVDNIQDENLAISFKVRDSGIGIPQDKLSRLFQSFSQVDSSITRKYGGTGLGLVISQRLVELMGGSITVKSMEGTGTTFSFLILSRASKNVVQKYVNNGAIDLKGKKVLIVDDNATNRTILQTQTKLWHMLATTASSGSDALNILARVRNFDLVITDMQMPEMDGFDLAKAIKETEPKLPIILLSSIGDYPGKEHKDLFVSVLSKPVKPLQLLKLIQNQFRGKNSVNPIGREEKLLSTDFGKMHPLKILVAEDNLVNQKLAMMLLNKLGYKPDLAINGAEAVKMQLDNSYEVILMDVQMPEMDGLEATKNIRESIAAQPVIIAMTANAMTEDKDACIASGMDNYISKPFKTEMLKEALVGAFETKTS